jgi:hypothetical protein
MNLFQPDNLCRPRAEFVSSPSALAALVGRVVDSRFGVHAPVLAAREQNGVTECFRVGELFVKTSRGPHAFARFKREGEVSLRLSDAGAPVARVREGAFEAGDEPVAFLAFPFLEGEHFVGTGAQLREAARAFGRLTTLAREVLGDAAPAPGPGLPAILEELGPLCARAHEDARTRDVFGEHGPSIARSRERVRSAVDVAWAGAAPVHVDYHPQNLLFAGDALRAVLDFEDLLVYPVAMASGFAAYKLVRRAAALALAGGGSPDPGLVDVWAAETGLGEDRALLEIGARGRVLTLLHLVLKTLFEDGDDRFVFDLGKHCRAFAEIDVIFQPGQTGER